MAKRILIVGGGTGGTMTANILASKLGSDIRNGRVTITLLSDSPVHVYQPAFLYVAFDRFYEDEFTRSERDLLRPDINFVVDASVGIDFKACFVEGKSGKKYQYDYLVLSTGSYPNPAAIPGLEKGGDWFYTYDGAKKLAKKIASFEKGRILLTVGVPHKCPVAPLEVTFMLNDYFKAKGIRKDVELYYTYPIARLHALEPVANWTVGMFEKEGIKSETFFNMESVDSEKKTVSTLEGSTIPFDLLIAVPPHKGADIVVDSGLSKSGWIPTNKQTLQVIGHDNVYSLGDGTDIPISKAGSTAHFEADVVAENLTSEIKSGYPAHFYDGRVLCFIETGLHEGTYVWFSYTTPPNPAPPSKLIHWMKLSFNRIYWMAARGLM